MGRVIHGIKEVSENKYSGVYILMLNAHQKPPHFLLVINGLVFGISVKGPTKAIDLDIYVKLIHQRKIKTLWLELKVAEVAANHLRVLENCIDDCPVVKPHENTCLYPINVFVGSVFGFDTSKVEKIFDLLDILESNNALGDVYHNHLELKENQSFELEEYSSQDIQNGIHRAIQKIAHARE